MKRPGIHERRMAEATANLTAWCTNHVAEYDRGTIGGEAVELLLWHQPGTGIQLMRFMCVGPRLIVTGDMGEGIYCRAPDLRWWAGLHLHYFAEKCQASEHGRFPVDWDPDEALSAAVYHIRETVRYKKDRTLLRRFRDADGPDAVQSEHDWVEFCREYGDEFFGQDWWEIRFGRVISLTTAYHLAGLKLAVAKLDAATPDAAGAR